VSPNIGRRRTPHEPREAAWASLWHTCAPPHDERCFHQDCRLVRRQQYERFPYDTDQSEEKQGAESFEDVIPHGIGSRGDEVSPETYVAARSSGDAEEDKEFLARIRDETHNEETAAYLGWYESMTGSAAMLAESPSTWDLFYEHVAGPYYISRLGYDGNTISAGEMRYCNTVQFIALYNDAHHDLSNCWSPEADDEDFECRGKYHLTGLVDKCVKSQDDCGVFPERHGCSEVKPSVFGSFNDGHPLFHPYCLETYRRVLELRIRGADLSDVADWIARRGNEIPYHDSEPPRHPAVDRGTERWWIHNAGDEFLVADPLHIPGLSALFEAAKRPQSKFDAQSSPFGERVEMPATPRDSFDRLPKELRDMVIEHLGSKDIASLRVASRSFRHLPYTLWHRLIKKEMPWIWETWTDRPYPYMSRTTERELITHYETTEGLVQAAEALPLGSE
jgi:hypothetical protein